MAGVGCVRFLGVLFLCYMFLRGRDVVGDRSKGMYIVVMYKGVGGKSGKAWVKEVLSKTSRKSARCCRPKGDNLVSLQFCLAFIMLLSGDVELNPGPTLRSLNEYEVEAEDVFVEASPPGESRLSRNERSAGDPAILEALARIQSGQAKMMQNQIIIISRIDNIESELKITKDDVEGLKKAVFNLQCAKKDIGFLLDKQEQYSRKSSVRVFNVNEEQDERVEDVVIQKLKKKLELS